MPIVQIHWSYVQINPHEMHIKQKICEHKNGYILWFNASLFTNFGSLMLFCWFFFFLLFSFALALLLLPCLQFVCIVSNNIPNILNAFLWCCSFLVYVLQYYRLKTWKCFYISMQYMIFESGKKSSLCDCNAF